MKIPSLFPDRKLILLLIQLGLGIAIGASFVLQYDVVIIIPIGIVVPQFIVILISKYKKYKELVFDDEKYQEKIYNHSNALFVALFPACYILITGLIYCLTDDSIRDIFKFATATVYFVCVFLLFISKLASHK